jgi:hypothetical protein
MVSVENIHTVYAKLENRPGTLERCAKVIGDRKINIDAISLETIGGSGYVRILTQRPREVVEGLKSAHIESYESPSLVISPVNKPGELARVLSEVAAAGINVESVLTTPEGKLCVRTSDNERAAMILRKL